MARVCRQVCGALVTTAVCAGLAACASPLAERAQPGADGRFVVFDPVSDDLERWEHYVLRKGETRYSMVDTPHGRLLEARGRRSASILVRVFDAPVPRRCRRLSWRWWVAELQPGAALTEKPRHDVGASVLVAFGDLGTFRDRRVPTLQYVWTNHNVEPDRVIKGPYRADHLRTIVVRRGVVRAGPVSESRDLLEDYRQAFGAPPETGVHAMAFFTDNDDTEEPVTAYYGPVELQCTGAGES